MKLTLFNTLGRKKEEFIPLKKEVGLYTCGPTVYNYAHIGNLRAYIFEDLFKRVLLYNGFKVKHVMNITDVGHLTSDADEGEDKMTKGLQREGLPLTLEGMKKLAQKYTKAFRSDLQKINVLLPDLMPCASQHIPGDIEFIKILEKKGYTYKTTDGIYFETRKVSDYGKLQGKVQSLDENHARLKHHDEKKDPRDFALWKFNSNLGWDTPWGKGFPGWHIECSVMASKYLGKNFDIHCGGKEHIPVHHTNEIAQSEAAFGHKPWVRYWLHNEWLILAQGEKMAKSGENFITLSTLEEKNFSPLDYRYFCLGTHYRKQLMFSYEALAGAKIAHHRLVEAVLELKKDKSTNKNDSLVKKYIEKFLAEINDDLNTSQALATLWEVIKDSNLSGKEKLKLIFQFDEILGFNLSKVKKEKLAIPAEVKKLAEERELARKNKDWKKADEMREKIKQLGFTVGDSAEGFILTKN